MLEKEKNKAQPFAAFLRPTEEMLWVSHPTFELPKRFFTRTRIVYIIGFVGISLSILLLFALRIGGIKAATTLFGAIGTILLIATLRIGLRRFFSILSIGIPRSLPRRAASVIPNATTYGITNERLLYRCGDEIRILPLENVTLLRVTLHQANYGTLGFNAPFPKWINIENAKQVKSIIEQAQKERLKAISG